MDWKDAPEEIKNDPDIWQGPRWVGLVMLAILIGLLILSLVRCLG